MVVVQWFFTFFLSFSVIIRAFPINIFDRYPESATYQTVYVDPSGHGHFSTIQAAINSVPSNNRRWICIYIKAETYREKVYIPKDKPFIYLKGEGMRRTIIVWSAADSIKTPTFTCEADNVVANSITFQNSFNVADANGNPRLPAVAAMLLGDKLAFYQCGFVGLQDTLWDAQGRHYFLLCTIQGAVDFIFGAARSIYDRCTIFVTAGALQGPGFITAQGRASPQDINGFVFKDCNIIGNGKVYLGRPWREYAIVIFDNTYMSNVVIPLGWNSGHFPGLEYHVTFSEIGCRGPGANLKWRVKWEAKPNNKMLQRFTSMSFIDREGWISKQAFNMLN